MWAHGETEVAPDRNDSSALRLAVGRVTLQELRRRATEEEAAAMNAVSPSLDVIRSGTRAILNGFLRQGGCCTGSWWWLVPQNLQNPCLTFDRLWADHGTAAVWHIVR